MLGDRTYYLVQVLDLHAPVGAPSESRLGGRPDNDWQDAPRFIRPTIQIWTSDASLPNTFLARAFSSDERWKILDLLVTGPLTESQIRKALRIPSRPLKAHLTELVNAHLVDVLNEELPSGKEAVSYRIAPPAQTLGFPPRKYEDLSEALIMGLVSSLGEKNARFVIRDIGLKLGEQMGTSLLTNTDLTTFTMKEYGEFVVRRFLAAQGLYPRILSQKGSGLVYEQSNCLFQELAAKMPGLVCDVMDEAVHEGLDRALNVKTARLACMGHGDAGCRFLVTPRD